MTLLPSRLDARWILVAVTFGTLPVIALGWQADYRSASVYAVFWTFSASVALTAFAIARHFFRWNGLPDALIRIGVLGFAIIVLCGLLLGSLGRLTRLPYGLLLAALLFASLFLKRSRWTSAALPELTTLPIPVVAVTAALLAFMVAFGATHSPLTLYDSLSYHLFFPARWLQDHRLSIIPTPFSDVAQAYTPGNGELFFLWLMLPFHGDLLARMGQLPFCLLGAVALYALARRLGAEPRHAIYPSVFFLLSRPVFEQAIGANVDLICAATFLTSLYLGIIANDRDEPRDWMIWGVSLGLYWGTKYVALVYTPVLLLLAVARGPRLRAIWALPGVVSCALPWYARNWLIAGSPIYPATLRIAGLTLAHGAYDRAAMLNTVFHSSDVRLFPAIAAHGFGPTLFLLWIPFALMGGVAMARRGWWPNGFVVLVTALMVPLYWFGFPVNIDSRFLMPAVGTALLPFAFAFRGDNSWDAGVQGVYVFGMLWMLIGVDASIPAALPWFMSDWLGLHGLLMSDFVARFGIAALLMAVAWWIVSKRTAWALPVMAGLIATTVAVLALGGERWCRPPTCDSFDLTSPHIQSNVIAGWRWLAGHATHSTIAYTGNNLPYPLTGDRLTNRVIYVNIDGRPTWRFHDYDRAYRSGRFNPPPPLLAIRSGELQPLGQGSGPHDAALRPRYERMQGIREAWVFSLHRLGVAHLFISVLSAYEIDYVWHNSRGFPVEDEWAAADPKSFCLQYDNPQVRIYAVREQ